MDRQTISMMWESTAGARQQISQSRELIEQSLAGIVLLDRMMAELGPSCRLTPASAVATRYSGTGFTSPVLCWERSGGAFYASICDDAGQPVIHGVAEALTRDEWTWMVWNPSVARTGTAGTAHDAMRSAEIAVWGL